MGMKQQNSIYIMMTNDEMMMGSIDNNNTNDVNWYMQSTWKFNKIHLFFSKGSEEAEGSFYFFVYLFCRRGEREDG